ncbi:methyl-accepting chemotaxis protein [Teredinibacter purpureus]|uniref:methyl-accepting chemotaxis protein n=1 Tax=Teredinibacter purpureus TaxID=2731756 RepID=UPI0006983A4E|nr:HAMP domain-containing methyl-accepting chemotaxis protein [Teredinibacter purpureus]
MNFIGNMRISHKISALMIGLVIGFIAIGVTYYIQVGIDKDQRQQELQALNFQNQLTEMSLQQLQLQSATSQFMSSQAEHWVAEYDRLYENITAAVKLSREGLSDQEGIDRLAQTEELLRYHHNLFNEAVTLSENLRGDKSLSRELNTSANALEKMLGKLPQGEAFEEFVLVNDSVDEYLSNNDGNSFSALLASVVAFGERWAKDAGSELFDAQMSNYMELFRRNDELIQGLNNINSDMNTAAEEVSSLLAEISASAKILAEQTLTTSSERSQVIQAIVTAIIFLVAISTAVGIYFIYRSIIFPMAHMQSVIGRINRGKTNARVKLMANDELGDLGRAFNKLFDERIQQLEDQSLENDQLNNSIISLIRALGAIANKDLTIKVPVSADITGSVSDAVNLLTTETAKTLQQVKDISNEVNDVSEKLGEQSRTVTQVAESERRQVIATSKSLDVLAKAMMEVAKNSVEANESATRAITNTRAARESVVETVSGIRTIRETISETEKRMKRLGDRSQEISGIVNLINTIAERTHILALNASMHAASAGEAGKGFAVVADEVQRLAESARQSTDEISSMVNNIRVETSDTVTIMNTLISQVADGSRMAERAGEQMSETETATQALVETVSHIAAQASKQAEVASRVRDRSTIIRNFTEKTAKQLDAQRSYTEALAHYAATLVDRVNVFALPDPGTGAVQATPKEPTLKSVG